MIYNNSLKIFSVRVIVQINILDRHLMKEDDGVKVTGLLFKQVRLHFFLHDDVLYSIVLYCAELCVYCVFIQ